MSDHEQVIVIRRDSKCIRKSTRQERAKAFDMLLEKDPEFKKIWESAGSQHDPSPERRP